MEPSSEYKPRQVRARSIDDLLPTLAWTIEEWMAPISAYRKVRKLARFTINLFIRKARLPDARIIQNKVVVFQSMFRCDYDELVDNVVKSLGDKALHIQLSYQNLAHGLYTLTDPVRIGEMPRRHLKILIEALLHLHLLPAGIRNHGLPEAIFLFLQLLKLRADLDHLARSGPCSVVVFAEMQPADRVMSMLCRKHRIPCATMQHGLYAEYNRIHTLNTYNYQPLFITDFLAWGSNTAKLIKRYAPKVKITICGKPTQKLPSKKSKVAEYEVVILFDQNMFRKENQSMVDIIREVDGAMGKRIGVRMHPYNDPREYDLEGMDLLAGDDWLRANTCVGHTTSFLIEVIDSGIPVFRYDSGAESVINEENVQFRNASDYRQLRSNLNADTSESQAIFDTHNYIRLRGDDSINAHRRAILGMAQHR